MLGRLIDQLFPVHVHEPSEARIVSSFSGSHAHLREYSSTSPWGNTLPLFEGVDINIINLETSVTTSSRKWPDKVFNYRMHPENLRALRPAKVTYAGLANNHTLDFSEEGLRDTVNALKEAKIAFAGAGHTQNEAEAPAMLEFPKLPDREGRDTDSKPHAVKIWAASDHPSDWFGVPGFSLIDYSKQTRQRLKELISKPSEEDRMPMPLKVFSVHWGPNYSWQPSSAIRSFAHFLIDECDIDIVHGHSSHHVQGVEVYKGKLIIYGCGDFVDDYALVEEYRNDLSAVWRVSFVEDSQRLDLDRLEIFPTRIKTFQAQLLRKGEPDFEWLRDKLSSLCADLGTAIESETGDDHQLVIDLRSKEK